MRPQGEEHRITSQIVRHHALNAIEDTETKNLTRSPKGKLEDPGKTLHRSAACAGNTCPTLVRHQQQAGIQGSLVRPPVRSRAARQHRQNVPAVRLR